MACLAGLASGNLAPAGTKAPSATSTGFNPLEASRSPTGFTFSFGAIEADTRKLSKFPDPKSFELKAAPRNDVSVMSKVFVIIIKLIKQFEGLKRS